MYNNISDFLKDWKSESQSTLEVFSRIDNKKKSEKINDHLRSLDRLAWHITQSITEMFHYAGIFDQNFLEKEPVPDTMEMNNEIYSRYSTELARLIKEKWENADLTEKIEMYGEMWEKRFVLTILVKHQIHHRGQMTAIMRMLDLDVPGIYGPSKEEWSKLGMVAQE